MSDDNAASPLAPLVSPLLEADPNSINDLIQSRIDDIFNKPPLLLSDADITAAVEYYRKERARFLLEAQTKPARGNGSAKRKTPSSIAEALNARPDDLL
jgi:hypothetical protein